MTPLLLDLVLKPLSGGIVGAIVIYLAAKKHEHRPETVAPLKGAIGVGLIAALGIFVFNYWKLG